MDKFKCIIEKNLPEVTSMSSPIRWFAAATVAVALVLSIGIAAPMTVYGDTVKVSITSGSSSKTTDAYSPNPVYIEAGDTVTWKNDDSSAHTVTSGMGTNDPVKGEEFDSSPNFSPLIVPQGTFSHKFNEAGEFPYFCALHPNMVGLVIVEQQYSVSIVQGSSSKTDDAYYPNPISISIGDTVKWTNNDSTAHTVTSGTGPNDPNSGQEFDSSPNFSPLMVPQGTFSHTFNQEGSFPYYCALHPNMVGVVQVSGDDEEQTPFLNSDINKLSYEAGETIVVTGSSISREYITFTLKDPNGSVKRVDQFRTNFDGEFSYIFSIAESEAVEGRWSIELNYENLEENLNFELVVPDEQEDEGFPLTFSMIRLEDIGGNPVTGQLSIGQQAVIAFRATNGENSAVSYTAIIQISDSNSNTDYIVWTTGTANPGTGFNNGFSWSPETAGSYTAKAFLWSSLNSPNPLAEPMELEISVG